MEKYIPDDKARNVCIVLNNGEVSFRSMKKFYLDFSQQMQNSDFHWKPSISNFDQKYFKFDWYQKTLKLDFCQKFCQFLFLFLLRIG